MGRTRAAVAVLVAGVLTAWVLTAWVAVPASASDTEIAEPTTTAEYVALARRFVVTDTAHALLVARYMQLTPQGRDIFKRRNARTRFIEHEAFATCHYRAIENGVRPDLASFRCYDTFVRKYVP